MAAFLFDGPTPIDGSIQERWRPRRSAGLAGFVHNPFTAYELMHTSITATNGIQWHHDAGLRTGRTQLNHECFYGRLITNDTLRSQLVENVTLFRGSLPTEFHVILELWREYFQRDGAWFSC